MGKRILMVVAGILLVLFGIFSLDTPIATLTGISIFTGIMLVISGIANIVLYFQLRGSMGSSAWTLVEGILVLLSGLFLLLSQNVLASYSAILPIFYSAWMLVSAIFRLVKSFGWKRLGFSSWWVMLVDGIIGIILGILLCSDYFLAAAVLVTLIPIMFILRGIFDIILGITMDLGD